MNTNTVNPHVATSYEVGAILYDNWGYEQTNIDYYCIIERKGDYVKVLPMKKNVSRAGDMITTDTPIEIDYSAKPIRKKVQKHEGKELGFTFGNYAGGGWCNLWNGKPKTATHYA